MQNMLLDIHVFPHDAHRQPPACGRRTRAGRDGKKRPTRKREAAANRKPPQEESYHPRGKRPPQPLPASMRSGPAAPSGKRARPSYPDYDRRSVEDFAARTRWMPSAVDRHSFASCPPLSPNTGVHTTHNARRIFEAIVWRYVRSARFIKVPPPCKRPSSSPKRCRLPRVPRSPISPPPLAGDMCRSC